MNKKQINDWVSKDSGLRLWDDKVSGLFLKRNAKNLSWNLSYKNSMGGKQSIKIGLYPTLTLDSARDAAKNLINQLALGFDPHESRKEKRNEARDTVQRYLDETYSKVLMRKKSGNESLNYFRRHCGDLLKLTFDQLNAKQIHKWHMSMLDKGLRDSSILRVYGAFKSLIYHAAKSQHIQNSPIQHVTLEKFHRPDQGVKQVNERRYFSQRQIKDFKNALDIYQAQKREARARSRLHGKSYLPDLFEVEFVDYVKPAILLMFYTGFRPGDIRTLDWREVNLGKNNPSITKVIEKTRHKNNEPQSFPLVPDIVDILKNWKKQNGSPSSGLVFPGEGGQLRTKRFLSDPWKKKIRQLANLDDDFDLYNLRHNFASWLVMSGSDLLTVAKLMGHANTKMIEKHYGHLAPEHKQSALAKAFTLMSDTNE